MDLSGRTVTPPAVAPDEQPRPGPRAWAERLLNPDAAPAAFVVLATIGLLLYYTGPICPDVSGQFWLAHAMRRGSRLYTDLVEINPPLWFWMAVPIEWLAEVLRVRSEPLTIIAVALWVIGALHVMRRLLADHERKALTLFLLYAAAILLILPMKQFEQREHLGLIGAVPYLVAASRRRQGASVPPLAGSFVGVAAALGLALKPYFLTVPVLIEAWLAVSLRWKWRPIRTETVALAGTCLLYLLAILLFTPRFLTDVLPRLYPVYEAGAPSLAVAFNVLPVIWAVVLIAILAYRPATRRTTAPLTMAFVLGFAGFAYSYFAQHKGWLYQGLPATGCLALALAAVLMERGWPTGRLGLFLPALLLWPMAFAVARPDKPFTPRNDLTPAFRDLKSGDAFGLISTVGATTWPSTVDRGLINASRYGQYWMLRGYDMHRNDPRVRGVMAEAVRNTILDFRCLPPKVIVFTRFDRSGRTHSATYDPYLFFTSDREFADLLGHYRLTEQFGIFDVYSPATPLPPVDRRLCRRIG